MSNALEISLLFQLKSVLSQAYAVSSRDYTLAECRIIPTHDAVKDLGVTLDSDLKFTLHLNNIAARAHSRANFIHKCFLLIPCRGLDTSTAGG